jgi:ParB/RepB/Spo0J family partition protein
MGKKAELFGQVLGGGKTGTSSLGRTDAHGTRRMAEIAAAESSVLERAQGEKRIIMMVDPADIEVDALLRDRDLEAARRDPDYGEFVEDVEAVGIKTPLVVRVKAGGGLLLVEGLRRLAAARDVGVERVPVIERRYDTDDDAMEDMLRENLQRQAPPPMETALLFSRLRDERGWSEDRIAALLKAKAATMSRLRTVARAFMPWLADAFPEYRRLPIVEMVKIAPAVEQYGDRLPAITEALQELAESEAVETKTALEAIRSIALTGSWAGLKQSAEPTSSNDAVVRTPARSAFDRSGAKAALLTHHEGQPVIRFTKRVPQHIVDRVWDEVQALMRDVDIKEQSP